MGSVPAKPVLIRELVVRVNDEMKICGKRTLFHKEFLSPFIEIGRGAGIDQENLNSLRRKFVGVELEVVSLLLAVRALIARIAAQDDQDHPALCCQLGELDRGSFGSGQGEIRGFAADVGGLRYGKEWKQEC